MRKLISLIDLTRLQENDLATAIHQLCDQAVTPVGKVAAVCIYPNFIRLAKQHLAQTSIKIATVVNFPQGTAPLAECVDVIKKAIKEGADEIDLVMPYQKLLAGKYAEVEQFLKMCQKACKKNIILKVILETGALVQPEIIAQAADIAIRAGADFIKTSTGKIAVGATPQAVNAILDTIQKYPNKKIGLKISGGIHTKNQALEYVRQIENKMGNDWITPRTLRFGASRLLENLLK